MRFRTGLALGLLLVVAESKPAFAIFHQIKVKEVFAGSAAHPTAQYVLLQAYTANQDEVDGHSVLTFDATGAPTGTFTFPAPVGNAANQMTILVATADAAAIFNLTADLPMTAVLSPAGGKVCWDGSTPDDCVAWGNYTGSGIGVGTPYNQDVGLIPGYAIRRRLDICMAIENLDACDDTDDSENDFITVIPQPITNMGDFGTTPPATCGNGALEGLEGCDDNNTTDGDGCSAICHPEPAPLAPASLLVDVTATGTSDVNGVFEPGETVRIEPTWTNGDPGNLEVRAQIANFTGPTTGSPPFPFYMISDGAAYYGVLLPAETKPCDADSDCYRVFADATNRPAQHWDASVDEILSNFGVKTWTLHIGASFADVSPDIVSDPYYPFIETVFHHGVTAGCLSGTVFCPTNPTTREQMAVFLLKASLGASYDPPDCAQIFTDVPCTPGLGFPDWIEDLYGRGITAGCQAPGDPLEYCPTQNVPRSQMAVFLLKTLLGSGYVPPLCTGIFTDVPCPPTQQFPYSNFIEDLFNRNITAGCASQPGPPPTQQYCPDANVLRQEMAVFLSKTFGLVLYGP
jgi:cysteine-rich repeat protein